MYKNMDLNISEIKVQKVEIIIRVFEISSII